MDKGASAEVSIQSHSEKFSSSEDSDDDEQQKRQSLQVGLDFFRPNTKEVPKTIEKTHLPKGSILNVTSALEHVISEKKRENLFERDEDKVKIKQRFLRELNCQAE